MKADMQVAKRMIGFSSNLQIVINRYYASRFSNLTPPTIVVEEGRKYYQVWKDESTGNHNSRSIHCFVNKSNGDILKAATWRAPAKHARGSIFDKNYGIGTAVGIYGAVYISGPEIGFDFEA